MNYYDRNSNGAVRWYDFIAVFWLMVLAWAIGQIAFTTPFTEILEDLDPEAADRLRLLILTLMTEDVQSLMQIAAGLFIVGSVIAAVCFGVFYLGEEDAKNRRTFLIIGLVGAAMSLFGGGLALSVNARLAEANQLILPVIGLSPLAYWLMLMTFPAALGGLYLGWKLVHKLPLTALHTSVARFRWGRTIQTFLIYWGILAAYVLISSRISGSSPALQFDAGRFAIYAAISLIFLPIQSATEEIVVRGYMNKGLIHMLGNKWVVFVITSGVFTALHLGNPEAASGAAAGNLPIVMSGYFFFGFAACLMVLIDDGLESAIGFHAANNTFAAIFVNYEGSVLPTPSIFLAEYDPNAGAIGTIVVMSVALVLFYWTRPGRRNSRAA